MTVALTALAVLMVPILAGAALGIGLRRFRGARIGGIGLMAAGLVLPAAASFVVFERFPVIGCWDAVLEGLLLGVGVLLGAHRAFARIEDIILTVAAFGVGLLLFEVGARLLLPPPPAFPTSAGAHFWLADAIRASGETLGWDMRSREIACSIIYGAQYQGLIDVSSERNFELPVRYRPRSDAHARMLHIGDSMVFGFGVDRSATFSAALGRLEPAVEQVNAGIPGLAPDAYLGVLEAWIARQRFDTVVMYIFEDNDLRDIDGPFPCCGFEPLLAYDDQGARLNCPTPSPIDFGRAGFEWLRYNSPPPYLFRVVIDESSAAAHVSAALVAGGRSYSLTPQSSPAERMAHLETILRTADNELKARHTHFILVTLPGHNWTVSNAPAPPHAAEEVIALARRLEIPVLDASPLLRAAVQRGEDIFVAPHDPHFNPAGHQLIAEWLHRALPAVSASDDRRTDG